jgi:hypothetical protein
MRRPSDRKAIDRRSGRIDQTPSNALTSFGAKNGGSLRGAPIDEENNLSRPRNQSEFPQRFGAGLPRPIFAGQALLPAPEVPTREDPAWHNQWRVGDLVPSGRRQCFQHAAQPDAPEKYVPNWSKGQTRETG